MLLFLYTCLVLKILCETLNFQLSIMIRLWKNSCGIDLGFSYSWLAIDVHHRWANCHRWTIKAYIEGGA